jgi:predicted AAA+ superfamily ATPase
MDFSFYRNSNGAEVDLIIETEKKNILAVEIKSSENPNQAELRGLFSFQELEPKAKLICLSRAEKMRIANGIHYYPWKLFFEEFF